MVLERLVVRRITVREIR